MALPYTHSLFTLFISLTAYASLVHARTWSTTTSTKKPFVLEFSPIHAATFAFYIIFGLITAFQALSAIGNLGRRSKILPLGRRGTPEFSTGVVYSYPIFLATASLLAFYVISAVWVVYTLNDAPGQIKSLSDAFYAGRNVTDQLSDLFILFALVGLIYHRQRLNTKEPEALRIYTYKLVLDGALLVATTVVVIVYACLTGIYSESRNFVQAGLTLLTLNRVYIALYIVVALDVTVSAVWTWLQFKRTSHPDEVMLGQLVKFVSPLLILRGAFRLFVYVVQNKPTFTVHDLDEVRLAHILTMGFAYFFILWFSL